MVETELGNWRRTHYSNELDPSLGESDVTVMGWISSVRGHGNISFATIIDKMGEIQIVAKKGSCPDNVLENISKLKQHSCVGIIGKVKASEKAPNGIEMTPKEIRIFSAVEKISPFDPYAKTVKNIDTEINTPKMIATATEGGAALFPIFYYNKEAFLAQSPQLYKEQLTMSFEKVFEIAPIFRAEPSRTNRHLSEAISIDFEEAFVDYNDVMKRIEQIIKQSILAIQKFSDNNSGTEFTIPEMPVTIPQYTYNELLEKIQVTSAKSQWGDDLYPAQLNKIGINGFYFIKDWPVGPKPFYVKVSKNDPKTSESFDLMYGDLELSSGSTRIEKKSELEDRMKNKGMKIETFGYHLNVFEYGVPPHAGCGIGLERLMMALTGTENIRDTTFYPRDVDRLTP